MRIVGNRKTLVVSQRGAKAGTVLYGCGVSNQGLRVQILQDQEKGHEGPLHGRFTLLDTGDNVHADALQPLLFRETDAAEVLRLIRQERPACVSVVNARSLLVETAVPVGSV